MRSKFAITLVLVVSFAFVLSLTPREAQSIDLGKVGDAFKKGKDIVQALSISYAAEREIGRAAAAQVASTFGICKDAAVTEYVRLVGNAVAAYCDRPATEFSFAVLDTDDVNAYAAPGGYIFITKGALKACKNEAELAGVLGHEIAHVTERHYVKSVQKLLLTKAIAEITIDALSKDFKFFNNLAENIAVNIVTKGLGRKDEFEADEKGTEFIARVGYNGNGVRDFLQTLSDMTKDKANKKRSMFATHPPLDKRVERVDKQVKKKGWDDESHPKLPERYLQQTKSLRG